MNQELKNSRKTLDEFSIYYEDENDWSAVSMSDLTYWVSEHYNRKYQQIQNRQFQDVSKVLTLKKVDLYFKTGMCMKATRAMMLAKYFKGTERPDDELTQMFKMKKKELLALCMTLEIGTDGKEKNAELQTYIMDEWYDVGYALFALKDWIINRELNFDDLVESKKADMWYSENCMVKIND